MTPFYGWGFNCLKATATSRRQKNVNNFQIAKVQPQGFAKTLLDFSYQFQSGVAIKV